MKFWQIIAIILLVSLIGIGVSLWQPWKTYSRTIETSGDGKVSSAPDVARITASVLVNKSTANEAQTEATTKADSIIKAVKDKGIADKDIQTQQISASPNTTYKNGESTTNGYNGQATIIVNVRDITKGQDIVNTITALGSTSVYGPNLTFSDEKLETLKAQARDAAVSNALVKATDLAKASKSKVGKVITITDTGSNSGGSNPIYWGAVAATDTNISSANSIAPGENEVTASVNVTFGLK
ncbi:MAG: SIMPL domain-containing protein [Candidatus Berkelbacteria bacterium]|nr:SIMPL domain-containing protein [Candidatus Berkelbacteria bacterium]